MVNIGWGTSHTNCKRDQDAIGSTDLTRNRLGLSTETITEGALKHCLIRDIRLTGAYGVLIQGDRIILPGLSEE